MLTVNQDQVERLLFLGLMEDANLLAMLGEKFSPLIFTEVYQQEVAHLYYSFFKKFGRLPSSEEVKLFYSYEKYKNYYEPVQRLIASIDYDALDKDILYPEFEKFIKERQAFLVLQEITENIGKQKQDALEPFHLVEEFENVANISLCDLSLMDIQSDVDRFYKESLDSASRLSTGWEKIDEQINGGILAKGKFIGVIMAETNIGKSVMLTNFATNAARQGKNVLVITLEMSEIVYATRLYADLYSVPIKEIIFRKEELQAKVEAHPEYGKIHVKEFPPNTMTVAGISGFLENLYRHGYKFDLICIDYLTLMASPNTENSNEAGKEITRGLRALTYKYECPIMTAAQLNRDGFDTVPSNKNVAEAIAIPQEADLTLGLYRQKEDREQGIMRVNCPKSRLGPQGWSLVMRYDDTYLRIEDPVIEPTSSEKDETKSDIPDITAMLEQMTA